MPAKIKQGKYVDSDGGQQNVVFIGAEKAIFDDNGTRLDNKLADMSKASGLTAEDAEGLLGTPDANVNFQALVDAIANKVMNELVTNSALTAQLANYVTKAMMSNEQVNDNDHVPTSSLVYDMNEDITQLNSDYLPIKNGLSTALPITLLNGWQANGQIRYVIVENLLLINGSIRNGDTAVNTILASGLPTGYFGVQANPTYTIAGGLIALRDNGELYIASSNGVADIRINLIAIKP